MFQYVTVRKDGTARNTEHRVGEIIIYCKEMNRILF